VVKLYVIFRILETIDKLCCAFGSDAFDALFSIVAEYHTRVVMLITHFNIAALYVFFHSLVLIGQVVYLNVAINSYSSTLVALLVSNQFVELKASVFKRFSKENLFQLSCSDVVERLHLFVFMICIMAQNVWDVGTAYVTSEWILRMTLMVFTVCISECLVDWLKHCFVTKFNDLTPDLYPMFQSSLCSDIVSSKMKAKAIDNNYMVSRRIGFVALPLGCLIVRVFSRMLPHTGYAAILLVVMWLGCVFLKTVVHIRLLAVCIRTAAKLEENSLSEIENEELKNIKALADVNRFTMVGGKIPT